VRCEPHTKEQKVALLDRLAGIPAAKGNVARTQGALGIELGRGRDDVAEIGAVEKVAGGIVVG